MNDANENKDLPWTVRKIRWFKKTYWLQALLSFLILFCLGAAGGFLWSCFTAERIQGETDEERQAQEREQDSDMEHAMLQSGLAAGLCGLALYGVLFLFVRSKHSIET